MKYWYIFFIVLLFGSCKENPELQEGEIKLNDPIDSKESVEQLIIRHIEGKLSIPVTEKYTYETFEADLNGDDSLDLIITVNQLDKALNEAIKNDNVVKRSEMGYLGNYNYFLYMDGATKEISPAIPVPSSPHAKLKVQFEHVRSEAFKDVLIDFRIRNSCFRRFFTIVKKTPRKVFEQKIFDGLGESNAEAFVINYQPGSYSLAKDILVYKAQLEKVSIEDPKEVYTIDPVIIPTDELERLWFFNANTLKYYTRTE